MLEDIKIVGVDVDGTLTDGMYYVSSNGVVTKSFFTRDFYAMSRLKHFGMEVLIVTGADDDVINRKLETSHFKGAHLIKNSKDKVADIGEWLMNRRLPWSSLAFFGDAENDLHAMTSAGWSACPSDAISEVRLAASYVSDFGGGKGAVYDAIREICKKKELAWQEA